MSYDDAKRDCEERFSKGLAAIKTTTANVKKSQRYLKNSLKNHVNCEEVLRTALLIAAGNNETKAELALAATKPKLNQTDPKYPKASILLDRKKNNEEVTRRSPSYSARVW
jgi:hypothetical protein